MGLEGDQDDAGRSVHLGHPKRPRQHPQTVGVDQGLRLRGQFAKTVHQLFQQGVHLVLGFGGGEFFIKAQAQMHVAAVVVGQKCWGVQIDFGGHVHRAEQVGFFAVFQGSHGLGQHLVVELETHFQHVAALVVAQHFARAPNFQIVHGQVKARAQFFHLLDGLQALVGLFGQALHIGHQQIGIGLVVAAANPSTQLVQLRQAKFIGAAHQDGVGSGHINTGFDDGRAQQDVEALRHKVAHHPLKFALGHLAMGHGNPGLGQQFFQAFQAVLDGFHFVVQEVALAAALEFAQHRFADDAVVLRTHKSFDGQAALRRGGNHAQVAQAFQGHAQGARDGRGGQGQHIHFGPKRFQGFFVAHTKPVFFVNHQQAQILVFHRFTQQLVGAHHDVHAAFFQTSHRGFHLFGCAKAAHLGDAHRPLGKAIGQGLEMLLGQQGGGGQDGDLLAAHDGDERGPQRHLGFAKAHIAADQAVHRARADHVLNHRMDGGALVGGFFKAEVGGKGFVVLRGVAEGMTLAGGAPSVDVEQLGGSVPHLLGGTTAGFVPLT